MKKATNGNLVTIGNFLVTVENIEVKCKSYQVTVDLHEVDLYAKFAFRRSYNYMHFLGNTYISEKQGNLVTFDVTGLFLKGLKVTFPKFIGYRLP